MKANYFIKPNESGIFCGDDKIARIDSRSVAEAFGKEHSDVLDAIENLDCSEYFKNVNFDFYEHTDEDGRHYLCYTMTREGFTYLVNSYIKEEYAQIRKSLLALFNATEALVNEKLSEKYT